MGNCFKLSSRILSIGEKEILQISTNFFIQLKFSSLFENLDRGIARIKREIIHHLFVGRGKAQEIIHGDHNATQLNEILYKISDAESLHLKGSETFLRESHVWQARYVVRIVNVVVDTMTGICFGDKGEIISETSAWPLDGLLANSIPTPIFSRVHQIQTNGFDNIILPSNGFYHWLVEDLPNVINLLELLPHPRLIVSSKCPKYVSDFIQDLNIPFVMCNRFVKLDSVTIITNPGDTGWPHPRDLDTLRKYFSGNFSSSQNLRIYITRRGFPRVEKFEEHLINLLAIDGWQIYSPEKDSLNDQVETFAKASVIVGLHGAGMCGMLWLQEGSRVVEILPRRRIQVYSRMSALIGVNYSQLYIDRIDPKSDFTPEKLALMFKLELDKLG